MNAKDLTGGSERSGFALMREEMQSFLDTARASEILAPILDIVRADLQIRLTETPGVLARQLSRDVAEAAAAALTRLGFPTRAIAESDVVEPPHVEELTRGGWTESSFVGHKGNRTFDVDPAQIVFFDVVIIPEHNREYEWSLPANQYDRVFSGGQQTSKLETHWEEFLHIVAARPWRRLSVSANEFCYLWPDGSRPRGGAANFLRLAQLCRFRCPLARGGQGFDGLINGDARVKRRVHNIREYHNRLTQQLTMLFLDAST